MDINEYINTQMTGKIVRRGNSAVIPLIITFVGIAALVPAYTVFTTDTVQSTLLSIGFIFVAVGLIWAVLCFANILWHYHYLPTSSPMQSKTLYLQTEDFHYCNEMLESGNTQALKTLFRVPSSNNVLCIIYSRDHSIALLQAGRMETSRLEPTSPVVTLTGDDAKNIVPLLR